MPWYGWHGWWMGSMWLFWVVIIVALIWIVVRSASSARNLRETQRTPEEILRERFARGEIDTEEFQRRLEVLRGRKCMSRSAD